MRNAIVAAAFAAAATCLAVPASAQDVDLMQFADTDADGKVTPAEFASFAEQGWGFFSQGADKIEVAKLDPMAKGSFAGITPDAGGFVSKETYLAATPARFKAADTNGDGVLDKDELTKALMPPA